MAARLERVAKDYEAAGFSVAARQVKRFARKLLRKGLISEDLPPTEYRAVLWDYREGQPGGGGLDSTLSYDQLPKTEWFNCPEDAEEAGRTLNARSGYDFFVRIENNRPPIDAKPVK